MWFGKWLPLLNFIKRVFLPNEGKTFHGRQIPRTSEVGSRQILLKILIKVIIKQMWCFKSELICQQCSRWIGTGGEEEARVGRKRCYCLSVVVSWWGESWQKWRELCESKNHYKEKNVRAWRIIQDSKWLRWCF